MGWFRWSGPKRRSSEVAAGEHGLCGQGQHDADHGYFIYHLATPLAPGATIPMSFTVTIHHQGFENVSRDNTIVANGTFINNFATFPHLGYNTAFELQEAHKRRKYGLAPVVHLFGIESPGLTASLALAERVLQVAAAS